MNLNIGIANTDITRNQLILSFSLAYLLTGCAIGPYGTLHSKVYLSECAAVVKTRSYGLHLRLARNDLGFSFGMADQFRVLSREHVPDLQEGTFIGYSPSTQVSPVAFEGTIHGLGVRLSPPTIGLTLGYERYALLAHVPEDQNLSYQLEMLPSKPELTRLSYSTEEIRCGT